MASCLARLRRRLTPCPHIAHDAGPPRCPTDADSSAVGPRSTSRRHRRQIIAPCSIIRRTKLREITVKLRDGEHCVTLSRIIVIIIYLEAQQQQHPLVVTNSVSLHSTFCVSVHRVSCIDESSSLFHVSFIAILCVILSFICGL